IIHRHRETFRVLRRVRPVQLRGEVIACTAESVEDVLVADRRLVLDRRTGESEIAGTAYAGKYDKRQKKQAPYSSMSHNSSSLSIINSLCGSSCELLCSMNTCEPPKSHRLFW